MLKKKADPSMTDKKQSNISPSKIHPFNSNNKLNRINKHCTNRLLNCLQLSPKYHPDATDSIIPNENKYDHDKNEMDNELSSRRKSLELPSTHPFRANDLIMNHVANSPSSFLMTEKEQSHTLIDTSGVQDKCDSIPGGSENAIGNHKHSSGAKSSNPHHIGENHGKLDHQRMGSLHNEIYSNLDIDLQDIDVSQLLQRFEKMNEIEAKVMRKYDSGNEKDIVRLREMKTISDQLLKDLSAQDQQISEVLLLKAVKCIHEKAEEIRKIIADDHLMDESEPSNPS